MVHKDWQDGASRKFDTNFQTVTRKQIAPVIWSTVELVSTNIVEWMLAKGGHIDEPRIIRINQAFVLEPMLLE